MDPLGRWSFDQQRKQLQMMGLLGELRHDTPMGLRPFDSPNAGYGRWDQVFVFEKVASESASVKVLICKNTDAGDEKDDKD